VKKKDSEERMPWNRLNNASFYNHVIPAIYMKNA